MYKKIIAKELTAARMANDTKLMDYLAGSKTTKSGKVILSPDSVLGRYNKTYGNNATGFAGTGGGGGGGGAPAAGGGGGTHP